jgi:hypothetical protein
LNPKEFWTSYPIPSSAVDDPCFSSEAEWKGKRMNCPWNGRVWPMTNSHITEAIAQSAQRFKDSELRKNAADFISKFIRMMFFEGDPSRPNSFEHYNPFSGAPCLYRGIDDYQHSWVVDLIIKYVAGVRPETDRVVIDPFPFHLDHVIIDRLNVRGRTIKVECNRKSYKVWVDGNKIDSNKIGNEISLSL